jgi:peptide chain release factor 2
LITQPHIYHKIYQKTIEERLNSQKQITGEVTDNGWGSQIRSYVLQPYSLVKDHRTNYESSNPLSVLDGNIDGFINAYLKMNHIKGE